MFKYILLSISKFKLHKTVLRSYYVLWKAAKIYYVSERGYFVYL